MDTIIPVIDVFAGPGGLGEGFSAFTNTTSGSNPFKITLSIEKDSYAHKTLTLRSFYRQFHGSVPQEYYNFIQGKITIDELYQAHPEQANNAKYESWRAQLGEDDKAEPNKEVDRRIKEALKGKNDWVLIGGPPCQAYSVVGRSRRQNNVLDERKDPRVGLYREYLRILAVHNPSVFVMENVKGLLSARTKNNSVFSKILNDLSNPVDAYLEEFGAHGNIPECPGYTIYSLTMPPREFSCSGQPLYKPKDFLIKCEDFGIPQARHRVILLGVRKGIGEDMPGLLEKTERVGISKVINGLPKLRSSLSKIKDTQENWVNTIKSIREDEKFNQISSKIRSEILKQLKKISNAANHSGGNYIEGSASVDYNKKWFLNPALKGVCNHHSRGHMESDLLRYMFVSCFGKVMGHSPKLQDFPKGLLPDHKNVREGIENKKFADRFRVQISDKPAKTITSHISKDGHYYIHPDPAQCRSLTVREAARIQTFPDDYFFCGPRTSQYIQVGNAVPPLLANQIAEIVHEIFSTEPSKKIEKSITEYNILFK